MSQLSPSPATFTRAVGDYIQSLETYRSRHTAHTYRAALRNYLQALRDVDVNPDATPLDAALLEQSVIWLSKAMAGYATATAQLHMVALRQFLQFLVAERYADLNLARVNLLVKRLSRMPSYRLPQFPAENIEKVVVHMEDLSEVEIENADERLIALRDRALILTLADTGMRIAEATSLRRGDVDLNEGKAKIIGKKDLERVVRFSERALRAIREYLAARLEQDGGTGRPLASLPLFARHDIGAGKKLRRRNLGITTKTGREIVARRVEEVLGPEAAGTITPHSFRHYFVTVVLQQTGNLKLAQELAGHRSIAVTQRYSHLAADEIDKAYHNIFNK